MLWLIESIQEFVDRVSNTLRKLEEYYNKKKQLRIENRIQKIMNELYSLDALIKIDVKDLPYIHRRLTEDGREYIWEVKYNHKFLNGRD